LAGLGKSVISRFNLAVSTATAIPLASQQHLVLSGMSWNFYEHILDEIGNRPLRVTFLNGKIEIMPPLPEHEWAKKTIALLIETMAIELRIPMRPYGSTTFRREDELAGLEPDECYYFANESKVRGMKEFNPSIHPAPDLAVEIDITRRSIPRQPIYAKLGVRELWRYDGQQITVMLLDEAGRYVATSNSPTFPCVPIDTFQSFIPRMDSEEQGEVIRQFRDWVSKLDRS